ncbi:MAG: right-handed parallel beta-helix repeat-containing protein [Myxococcota bacterium]
MWTLALLACHRLPTTSEPCPCADGHAARTCDGDVCGPCACLPAEPVPDDPAFATERYVDPDGPDGDGTEAHPWATLHWPDLDRALAAGDVRVRFARGTRAPDPIRILRTDPGPHRLVLDGDAWGQGPRASAPGVTTTEAHTKRSYVTVRGFDLSDTVDQGVFWEAGDGVVLEDLVVHDNGRSPGILFEYAARSGLPSADLTIRNNHLYDIRGECIYVGGADGTDGPGHDGVLLARNLVHHCGQYGHGGDDWDGINVKDHVTGVVLRENVVYAAHWGLQLDSAARIEGGLVYDVRDHGVMMGGTWGDGYSGTVVEDLAVLRADGSGVYVGADEVPSRDVTVRRLTVDASDAAVTLAGHARLSATLDDLQLTALGAALDGWGEPTVDVSECHRQATPALGPFDVACPPDAVSLDTSAPAGPDGRYFTADDPWLAADHGAALRSSGE